MGCNRKLPMFNLSDLTPMQRHATKYDRETKPSLGYKIFKRRIQYSEFRIFKWHIRIEQYFKMNPKKLFSDDQYWQERLSNVDSKLILIACQVRNGSKYVNIVDSKNADLLEWKDCFIFDSPTPCRLHKNCIESETCNRSIRS